MIMLFFCIQPIVIYVIFFFYSINILLCIWYIKRLGSHTLMLTWVFSLRYKVCIYVVIIYKYTVLFIDIFACTVYMYIIVFFICKVKFYSWYAVYSYTTKGKLMLLNRCILVSINSDTESCLCIKEAVPGQISEMINAELTPEKDAFLSPYTKVPEGVMEPSTWYVRCYCCILDVIKRIKCLVCVKWEL